MKKTAIACALMLCLLLSACSANPPEKTADGADWGADWTTVSAFLGVEPMDGWTVQRNEDMLRRMARSMPPGRAAKRSPIPMPTGTRSRPTTRRSIWL